MILFESTFTEAKAEEIIRRLSRGEPLAVICRSEGMPTTRTISNWRKANPEFDKQFLQARDDGYDEIAADCLRIADTPMPGTIQKRELLGVMKRKDEDGEEQAVVLPDAELVVTEERVEDMLGHRKLQIETRLKLLAKWDPRRYGERIDLNHGGKMTLEQLVAASAQAAAPAEPDGD